MTSFYLLYMLALLGVTRAQVIQTDSGPVIGFDKSVKFDDVEKNVKVYLGIPYAQPPVNELRFAKPKPVLPWTDVLNATAISHKCMQPKENLFNLGVLQPMSEDCLYLNIYVPEGGTSTKAVMIFIHGGAFILSTGNDYDGGILATRGDVIVITLNYRLGLFGFLYSGGEAPSNVGLWDQHQAILWAHKNIAAFGGDVDRVTIFGESAGSISVAYQMLSPHNNNTLFQRAIMQSGGTLLDPFDSAVTEGQTITIANANGCKSASKKEALTCLRKISADDLQESLMTTPIVVAPKYDGDFITERPQDIHAELALGNVAEIRSRVGHSGSYDVIIGITSQEGLLFYDSNSNGGLNLTDIAEPMWNTLLKNVILHNATKTKYATSILSTQVETLYKSYLPKETLSRSVADQRMRMITDMMGDTFLAFATVESALLHSAVAEPNRKTYFYELDHKRSTSNYFLIEGPAWLRTGTNHGEDVLYVFGVVFTDTMAWLGANFTDEERQLSLDLMTYWSNFAKNGDPDTQSMLSRGGVIWPEIEEGERKYLRFTTDTDVVESRPLGGRADFWRSALTASVNVIKPDEVMKPAETSKTNSLHVKVGTLLWAFMFVVKLF